MPERIYRVLLRLYPSRFRRTYGEEALQLFRDRMGDERGWLRRSRLWLDLLLDLAVVRIRGYHETAIIAVVASAEGSAGRIPSFASLEERPVEARFLAWGGFLSLILCGAVLFALQHGGGRLPRGIFDPNALFVKTKMNPKIVFSYEPIDATEGSMVRLHAVVSAEGDGPKPTGKVNFLHGWNIFVAGTLVNGSATVDTKVPKEKKLPLNALYLGDSNYNSVSSVEKDQ